MTTPDAAALPVECEVTGGDHVWVEGGARDWGRYSCSRCQRTLHVLGLIHTMRQYRSELLIYRAAILHAEHARFCDDSDGCTCGLAAAIACFNGRPPPTPPGSR